MKQYYLLLIVPVLFLISSCKTTKPLTETDATVKQSEEGITMSDYSDQTTWLLGYFKREQLYRTPHCEWYLKGYDDYQFNSDVVNKLEGISTDGITIKIIMGTWCPDSRREVPRFIRILDLWKFPMESVTFIGVDDAKLSPVGEFDKLNIERVPTFIFYKKNIETGRIIENPTTSLEQDIVNILTRE
jgi:thiol-disulfide isomerase/thioredoxin